MVKLPIKFDSQLLTPFTSSLYIDGLIASFLASPVTRTYGCRPSITIGGVVFLLNALNRTRYKQKGRGSRCPVSESGGPGGRRAPWPGGPGGRRRPRPDGIQGCCIGPLIFCQFCMLGPSLLGRSLALYIYIDAMANPIL